MNLREIGQYYIWADKKIRDLINDLSEEEFSKVIDNTGRSIKDLVEHMISTYETFDVPFNPEEFEEKFDTLSELSKKELLDYWIKAVSDFTSKVENSSKDKADFVVGENKNVSIPYEEYLLSYTDHNSYHRGQLVTFYKVLTGKEAVNTDYYLFLMEKYD
ncbi:MAG: DinB family protein [Candidatus Hodarchaeales archaeon]|jgi:uncharacterized damage-inducible protein DinB